MTKLVKYANENSKTEGAPYYSLDGQKARYRRRVGLVPFRLEPRNMASLMYGTVSRSGDKKDTGADRPKPHARLSAAHLNQKPLDLIERSIRVCTQEGDVVWEPFGGLCTATLAAVNNNRRAFAAERNDDFYALAVKRLQTQQTRLF
jgi:DNA modification methylase